MDACHWNHQNDDSSFLPSLLPAFLKDFLDRLGGPACHRPGARFLAWFPVVGLPHSSHHK